MLTTEVNKFDIYSLNTILPLSQQLLDRTYHHDKMRILLMINTQISSAISSSGQKITINSLKKADRHEGTMGL